MPLPPAAPALGGTFPFPATDLGAAASWIPKGNLHEFDIGCGPGVATPPPPAVKVFQDLAGADQIHFRLPFPGLAGGYSAYVIFGASPWGSPAPGGSGVGYAALLTSGGAAPSPFWTTPRYDDPLGATPPGTFAFLVVCLDPMGLVAAVSDPVVIIGVPELAETGTVVEAHDHYFCYDVKGNVKPKKVTLTDQFETQRVKIQDPKTFCNPVQKNKFKIDDKKSHLTWYPISKFQPPSTFLPQQVLIDNQFGPQALQIQEPKFLLVPTEKENIQSKLKIDHFKCYSVDGDFQKRKVRLKDQFGKTKTKVLRPEFFCNPVQKNKKKIRRPWNHLVCYLVKPPQFKSRDIEIDNQFGKQDLRVIQPKRLCVPSLKMDPFEIDTFPNSLASVTPTTPTGATQEVDLQGPTTVRVDILGIGDPDGDGKEQVPAELLSMNLTGTSPLGPVTVTIRDPAKHPLKRSVGEIEESANTTPGVLDLPPFTAKGSADSHFDVLFNIQVGDMMMHNDEPKRMQTVIDHKPPGPGETYEGTGPPTILVDENETDTGWRVGAEIHTPQPPAGFEVDTFSNAQATVNLSIPPDSGTVMVTGMATFQADLAMMGGGGPWDVLPVELVALSLTGTDLTFGQVTVRRRDPMVDPMQPSRGQFQEQSNDIPGILEVPPFTTDGMALGGLNVYFEIEAGGQTYHTHTGVQLGAIVHRKPAGPGDMYQSFNTATLYDQADSPVGTIQGVMLTPSP